MNGTNPQHPQHQQQDHSPWHSWRSLSRWVIRSPRNAIAVFLTLGVLFWLGVPQAIWGQIVFGVEQILGAVLVVVLLLALMSLAIRGGRHK